MQYANPAMETMNKKTPKTKNEHGHTNDCTLDYNSDVGALYMQGYQSSPV